MTVGVGHCYHMIPHLALYHCAMVLQISTVGSRNIPGAHPTLSHTNNFPIQRSVFNLHKYFSNKAHPQFNFPLAKFWPTVTPTYLTWMGDREYIRKERDSSLSQSYGYFYTKMWSHEHNPRVLPIAFKGDCANETPKRIKFTSVSY